MSTLFSGRPRWFLRRDFWLNTALVLVLAVLGVLFLRWAVVDAQFLSHGQEACHLKTSGACWSVITQNTQLLFFGVYPKGHVLYALGASCLMLLSVVILASPRFWNRYGLIAALILAVLAFWWMDAPLLPKSEAITTSDWSGLPLTILLAATIIGLSLPFGLLLALARTSEGFLMRAFATVVVEAVRSVPAISILFFASFLLPLLLPQGWGNLNKITRVILGLTLFASAYVSEVVRGSMRGVPKGQKEAAMALGLSYWKMQRRVLLPQVLFISIPGLTSISIGMLKVTSLVLTVGLFDFLSAAQAVYSDPQWGLYFMEVLLVTGLGYYLLCNAISLYGAYLEKRFRRVPRA